jgi:hypothetical protein
VKVCKECYRERKLNDLLNEKNANWYWNDKVFKTYDMLIEGLFNGGNGELVYNPKTNLYF